MKRSNRDSTSSEKGLLFVVVVLVVLVVMSLFR